MKKYHSTSLNLPNNIPKGSVIGLNYSGMHDTALAVVAPDGEPIYAVSLERLTRIKQDGRAPYHWLDEVPWDLIDTVAVPTNQALPNPEDLMSKSHPLPLSKPHEVDVLHDQSFYDFLGNVPCNVEYVCHRVSHVASSFWGSEFDEALCLNYDGGMANDPWFGGVFYATRSKGLQVLDQFSARYYAKITLLYQVVTSIIGFTANRHEGKVTGLAAYGTPTKRCEAIFERWLREDFISMERTLKWLFTYDDTYTARIVQNSLNMEVFAGEVKDFSKEELAATLQKMAEDHVLAILDGAKKQGWESANVCLSGGLFANVKINQRVVEAGFDKIFVAPPMTDDGTALGAAWHVLSQRKEFSPQVLHSMYLGPKFKPEHSLGLLNSEGVKYTNHEDNASEVARLLADGAVVAVYQGAMEFGPRALGNRSIIASAEKSNINQSLNDRLNRTEFMPFAPIGRYEDAHLCYENIGSALHSAEFMTITVNCTALLKTKCPAVVHIDGTARPQLVTSNSNPFIYDVLTNYQNLTTLPVLVNTSFNIHEEPIVCTPEDAIKGFFESALDYLYIEGVGLIPFKGNEPVALKYMQERNKQPSVKVEELVAHNQLLSSELGMANEQLEKKEEVIQELKAYVDYVNSIKTSEQEDSIDVSLLTKIKTKLLN